MVSRIQQSLSFHNSPETFISSRLQQLSISDPDSLPTPNDGGKARSIVKASILNRNVHIISSYRLCEAVLSGGVSTAFGVGDDDDNGKSVSTAVPAKGDVYEAQPIFAAEPAYAQFMSAFFPGPNILLQDGPEHMMHKERWKRRMLHVVSETSGFESMIKVLTTERFIKPVLQSSDLSPDRRRRRTNIDLYDAMKSLSWDLLFGVFLGLNRNDDRSEFAKAEELQEGLLRGQFSMFPVSIRTPFWSSPRSKGLYAVKSLQGLLARRLEQLRGSESCGLNKPLVCPFMRRSRSSVDLEGCRQPFDEDDMIAHLLIFTSSIANKALASLLTAYLLNLFLWRDGSGNGASSLAHLIRGQDEEPTKARMLGSILAETERLSPPVVGVMRRVKQDIVLRQGRDPGGCEDGISEYTIPNGHDAWLYLAGASRDPEVFEEADNFVWDRYMSDDDGGLGRGFAFGGGVKTCLGNDLARQICLTVANTVLDSDLSFEGVVPDHGVKHWLGWQKNVPLEIIAKDLKQLPCQRPRRPVRVEATVDR